MAGRPPDRIPWIPRLEIWFAAHQKAGTLPEQYRNCSLRDVERDLGVGNPARNGIVFRTEMNGVEAFRKIKEMDPDASVILMTAFSEEDLIDMARNEGARRVIHKPIKIDRLIEIIREAAAEESIIIVDKDADIGAELTKVFRGENH